MTHPAMDPASYPVTVDGWVVASLNKLDRKQRRLNGYRFIAQVYNLSLFYKTVPLLIHGTSKDSVLDAIARAVARGRKALRGDTAILEHEQRFQDMAGEVVRGLRP